MSVETEPAAGDSDDDSENRSSVEPVRDSRSKQGLVLLLVGVVVLGLLRPFYPTASALAIGSLLALFGAYVGLLAVRERRRGS